MEECVISDQEWEENSQEQEDEILVLGSILGDDFQVLEQRGASRAFTITLNVELTDKMEILACLPTRASASEEASSSRDGRVTVDAVPSRPPETPQEPGGEGGKQATAADDCGADGERDEGRENRSEGASSSAEATSGRGLSNFTVQFLPPIHLLCTLPRGYPSRSPPEFSILTRWLNGAQISRLCEHLDNMWEEQAGQVVIYSWVEWLRHESIPFLEINNSVRLGSYGGSRDPRAVPEGRGVEEDLVYLLRFNEDCKTREFCQAAHLCGICFTEFPGTEFLRLSCDHAFCADCMKQYASMHIKEGTVKDLVCPDMKCKHPLSVHVVRELLPKESFERWEDLTLQKTLDSMADLVYCPRCKTACIEEEDHHTQCTTCFFSFCSLCTSAWHSGTCMSPEARIRILQERQNGRSAGEEARRKELNLLNELLSLHFVKREAKQCPSCKMAIEKSAGCNKMTCRNCSTYFCYRCGAQIKDYDHFKNGKCVLFDEEVIQEWNRQAVRQPEMDMRQNIADAGFEIWPARTRTCPSCGRRNLKEHGNNHIRCWACTRHFCGLCHQMVPKSSVHYGPNKCKQHTAD